MPSWAAAAITRSVMTTIPAAPSSHDDYDPGGSQQLFCELYFFGLAAAVASPNSLSRGPGHTVSPPNTSSPSLSVDALFARLHYDRSNGTPPRHADPDGQSSPSDQADGMPPHAELQPPPPLENPADLQAAHEWLQTERAR